MEIQDYSRIDFSSIEVQGIPKPLYQISNLYRACKFEEAEFLLNHSGIQNHQTADIMAQIEFFQWNFDKAIEYILEYYAYQGEWYSGNKKIYTEKMLAFSLLNATKSVKEKAIEILQCMYHSFTEEQLKDFRNYRQFAVIPKIIDIANGNAKQYFNTYKPRENPADYSEIFNDYEKYHEKDIKALRCAPEEDAFTVGQLLILIAGRGKTDDFIKLYERHCKSSKLSDSNHIDAIRIYMYLNDLARAKAAAINYVKYAWYPIENTDVMPLSLFYDYSFMELFTKEFFEEIFYIPKGVDIDTKLDSQNLLSVKNYDTYSDMPDISKISVLSGKLSAGDLVYGLSKQSFPYYVKFPKGEYNVKALMIDKKLSMIKVNFTDIPAVKFVNALIGNEAYTDIDELESGKYFGFENESGIVTIADDKVKKEYFKYLDKWKKKNKKGDFYADFIEKKFEEASEKSFEAENAKLIDFVIPETEYHMPILKIDDKRENCPVFIGYDCKGRVCSIVIEIIDLI